MASADQCQSLQLQLEALRAAKIELDLPGALADSDELNASGQNGAGATHFDGWTGRQQQLLETGIKCGRLPVAFETLSRHAQQIRSLRTRLLAALVYPLIVCGLAYGLTVFMCLQVLPEVMGLRSLFRADAPHETTDGLTAMVISWMPIWSIAIPLFFLVCVAWWYYSTKLLTHSAASMGPLRLLPGAHKVVRDMQWSATAELTGLLVKRGVSSDEAFELASTSVHGKPMEPTPPFFDWALRHAAPAVAAPTSGAETPDSIDSLNLAADLYEERAKQRSVWMAWYFPLAALGIAAGGLVLLYALLFWAPFAQVLQYLGDLKHPT